jgi:hypothetical protein
MAASPSFLSAMDKFLSYAAINGKLFAKNSSYYTCVLRFLNSLCLDNFSRKVGNAKRTVRVGMPVIKYTLQYPPLVLENRFDMYAGAIEFHL